MARGLTIGEEEEGEEKRKKSGLLRDACWGHSANGDGLCNADTMDYRPMMHPSMPCSKGGITSIYKSSGPACSSLCLWVSSPVQAHKQVSVSLIIHLSPENTYSISTSSPRLDPLGSHGNL